MSDTPIPDELVEHIARLGIPASERRPDALDRQRAWNMLQALAEWADVGLIDPSTWTVVDPGKVVSIVGDMVTVAYDQPDPTDPDLTRVEMVDLGDDGRPDLWLLSPREGEHERCPAGICRRPVGHAGPHSGLPREGER